MQVEYTMECIGIALFILVSLTRFTGAGMTVWDSKFVNILNLDASSIRYDGEELRLLLLPSTTTGRVLEHSIEVTLEAQTRNSQSLSIPRRLPFFPPRHQIALL